MRQKIIALGVLAFLLFTGACVTDAFAEAVKMRLVVVNPSADKEQTKDVKKYLPKEVKQKDVRDAGGLEIEYDQEQGMYYVFKNGVELKPLESKTFEVIIEDVWVVAAEDLERLRKSTENITAALKDSVYFGQADLISKTIYGRLDEILRVQTDETVTRQQHIADYRDNLKMVELIKKDIEKMEKILVAVGGPPNLELIEESDINLKSPSSKTTWIIIFIVLIFMAILIATFFYTWHRQAHITENIFTREKDASFSEFKSPDQGGPAPGGVPPKP